MVSKSINLIFRSVQLIFALVLIALLADIFSHTKRDNPDYYSTPTNPPRLGFAMFAAAFSVVSLVWIVFNVLSPGDEQPGGSRRPAPVQNPNVDPRDVALEAWLIRSGALEILNTIFFFSGAVALAVALGAYSCDNEDYTDSNPITRGGQNPGRRCREAQAVTAFMFFAWLSWAVTLFLPSMPRLFADRSGSGRNTGVQGQGMQAAPSADDAPPKYESSPAVPINLRRFLGRRSNNVRPARPGRTGGPAMAADV